MRRFFSILAMVAVLAFVGCEKESEVNQPLTLEGAQWIVEGLNQSIQNIGVCRAGYDFDFTEKGKVLSFVIIDEPLGKSPFFEGDVVRLTEMDYTAEYDEKGNMIQFSMIDDGRLVGIANITMHTENSATLSQEGGEITARLQRAETPLIYAEREL